MQKKKFVSVLTVAALLLGCVFIADTSPAYAAETDDEESEFNYKLFAGESRTIDVGEKVTYVESDDGKVASATTLSDEEEMITISAIRPGSTSIYATTQSGAVEEYKIKVRDTGLKFKVTDLGKGVAKIEIVNERKIAFEELKAKYVLRDENLKEVRSGVMKIIEVPADNTYTFAIQYNPALKIDPDNSAFHIRSFRYKENELNEDASDDVVITAEEMPDVPGTPVMVPKFNVENNGDTNVHVLIVAEFYDKDDMLIGTVPFNVGGIVAGEDEDYQVYEQNLDYVLNWNTIKLVHYAWTIGIDKYGEKID